MVAGIQSPGCGQIIIGVGVATSASMRMLAPL